MSNFSEELVDHIRSQSVRVHGQFTVPSGQVSSWFLDARQTTFDGAGERLIGAAVFERSDPSMTAVGGMTMRADPIAVATAAVARETGRALRSFSVRNEAKDYEVGGRLVGPVSDSDGVAALEDTVPSGGAAALRCLERGVPLSALVNPADLGVEEK